MPAARPAFTDAQLRAIWFRHPEPVVRALLWEIRRLKDEAERLRKVVATADSFATAVDARSGLSGDMQLQLYWNRLRSAIEAQRSSSVTRPSAGG